MNEILAGLGSCLGEGAPCNGPDDAAMVLEEIAPEDKTRNEILGARVNLYMAARK